MTREDASFQITASIKLCLRDIDIYNNLIVTAESVRTNPLDPTLLLNLSPSSQV